MPFLTEKPLIANNTYVFFKGSKFPKRFANKLFKVEVTQQIPNKLAYVLTPKQYIDIDLSKVGLYPENVETLYELRFGIKGDGIIYPRYPTTSYYNILEYKSLSPGDFSDPNTMYIGGYGEEEIPYDADPLRLVEYTVYEFDSIYYRLFMDSVEADKVVLRILVNRCKLTEPTDEERSEVMQEWDEFIASNMLRVIPHPDLAIWGVK